MSQFKDKKLDIKQLIHDLCKQIKGLTQQVFLTVWQAFRKVTFQQLELDRTIVILESFYLQLTKHHHPKSIKVLPTLSLLAQAGLNYRAEDNDLSQLGALISVTEGSLYKQIETKDKQNMEISKHDAFLIFNSVFKHIKVLIKKYKNISIQLDFLGTMSIYERTFIHEPEHKAMNSQKVKIKQLIEKQSVKNCSDLKRQSIQSKSNKQLLPINQKTKQAFLNTSHFSPFRQYDLTDSHSEISERSDFDRHFQNKSKLQHQKSCEILPKRPLYHDMIDTNHPQTVRIINDLLGAGIDPLTYDYNHSKLVQNRAKLIAHKFQKPQKAKMRFPALIDKFSRTIGSQLTGAKVSTSSSIRIGSNYTPSVKTFYIDLSKKQILRVPPQLTIKLQEKLAILPATEQQEYEYMTEKQLGQKEIQKLQQKVQMRRNIYQRYCEYCLRQIPNECVAELSRQTLKRVVETIKQLVKSLGKSHGKEVFDRLLNEVNRHYYMSGKKAIVDYILKDESEKSRTGIHMVFKEVEDWGDVRDEKKVNFVVRKENTLKKKHILEQQFLTYPDLILQIARHSQMLDKLLIFSEDLTKSIRPMNILYYLKKHSNHLGQLVTLMNQKWIKGVVEMMRRGRNWKKQPQKQFKTFINNVHTLMSNKLKQFMYKMINQCTILSRCFDYEMSPLYTKPILYLHLGEENKRVIFMDDLNSVYKREINTMLKNVVKQLSILVSPECYIREGKQRYLSSIDEEDEKLVKYHEYHERVINMNYEEIEKIKVEMRQFQKVYKYKEELVGWARNAFTMEGLDERLEKLKAFDQQIEGIPFFRKTLIAVVDCHDLKKKLAYEVKLMRYLLFQTIQTQVKKKSDSISQTISTLSQTVSKQIKSTADYVQLSKLIQSIKQTELAQLSAQIYLNQSILMKLFIIDHSFVSHDLLMSIYALNKALAALRVWVAMNEERILKERAELEKTLKQRISYFQSLTSSHLRQTNMKIDSFQIRKLYQQYLIYLQDYRDKSEKNIKEMSLLNHEEQDLKWAVTTFTPAIDMENLIAPNFELWKLVEQFDLSVREWKHIELCNFVVEECEAKVTEIDAGLAKIINKLKNFSSLKVALELQNDLKEIITKQLAIIRIFSHPGLKQRHWHLFNKKLAIPGYDLKQITYSRIKMLYDYQKNLKVLTSISNQAAKQFQVENQKNQMTLYWYSLNCQIQSDNTQENLLFLNDHFLNKQIALIDDHLMRTVLIKNSPFSKALVQILTDWENYLASAKNILVSFKNAQQKFTLIKDVLKIDEISKHLPFQNTEFQSIQNIWKSVIRKVLQQPKISQLFKSQKIIEILDQISKKSIYIRNALPTYFHAKRVEFPRFFFMTDDDLIALFSLLNKGNQKQALLKIASSCFNGVSSIQKLDKGYKFRSSIDSFDIIIDRQTTSKRHKIKIVEEAPLMVAQTRAQIKQEILILISMKNLNESEINLGKFTVTAILAVEHLKFTQKLAEICMDRKKESETMSDQIEKQLMKYSRQLMESIQSKMQELNINEVRKADFVMFRRLSFIQLIEHLVKRKHEFTHEYQLVPKLILNETDPNSLISLQIDNQKLTYDFEYQGDSICSYPILNHDTLRMMHYAATNLNSYNGSLVESRTAKSCVRMLSQLAGRFYKSLCFVEFVQESSNAGNELVGGMISADAWVELNMEHEALVKVGSEALSLVASMMEEKRTKIKSNSEYMLVNDSEMSLSRQTGIFLTIPIQISSQLPQRFFSDCRSISRSVISAYSNQLFTQLVLAQEQFADWQMVSKIKLIIQFVKVTRADKRVSISELLGQFGAICQQVQDSHMEREQGVVVCRLLERYLLVEEECVVRNFFRLRPKQIQAEIKLKKPQITYKQASPPHDHIDAYLNQKHEALSMQSKFFDTIIVYGQWGFKTTLIHKYLQAHNLTEQQCNGITINSSFIAQLHESFPSLESTISQVLKLNEKPSGKYTDAILPVIFDGPIDGERLGQILDTLKRIKQRNPAKRVRCFIECPDLQNTTPSQLSQLGKVHMNSTPIPDKTIFERWLSGINLDPEQTTYLKSLQPTIQNILNQFLVLKSILQQDTQQSPKRYRLLSSFLRLFKVYLLNLNSKQVQALPEFDAESYIVNSMVFASYWSLAVGYCGEEQRKAFQHYIKVTFGSPYDLPNSIQDHFLNQENQWVHWENLKEDFCPEKDSQIQLPSLWVPTVENSKFYTMVIKMIENDIPILLVGSQTAKTTLVKQICNFQTSYTTFVIDCNSNTRPSKVNQLIRKKISYGDQKKYLVLVDDIHMPLKNNNQTALNELLLQLIKRSSLPNTSVYGQTNVSIKKSNIIATTNDLLPHESIASQPVMRMMSKFQPISLKRMDEKQTEAIFRPYINFSFLHNEFDNQIVKLQNVIINFAIKTVDSVRNYARLTLKREVAVDINDVRKIVESVCRLTRETAKDKNQLLKFLIFETYHLLEGKIMMSERNSAKSHAGDELLMHFKKVLESEYTKLCSPEKGGNEFESLLSAYIYRDLPAFEGQCAANDLNELKGQMRSQLKIKNENPDLILTDELVSQAQKMLHMLKASPSHFIYVTPAKFGARSFIKLVAQLKSLIYIELGTTVSAQSFIQQLIKIVKTGGKIDECICCLPNEQTKQGEFMQTINSLIGSTEFYESLTQIELEQMIKSFNSQKKILKKDIKKSQIIKKIKEKLNSIFHFVVCVDRSKFKQIHRDYPNMVRDSFVIVRDAWSDETVVEMVGECSLLQKDQIATLHSVFTEIYTALKNVQFPASSNSLTQQAVTKTYALEPLRLVMIYKTFQNYIQKIQLSSTQSINMWQKKISANQAKLAQLNSEKVDFEKTNQKHFKQIKELMDLVNDKAQMLDTKKEHFKQAEQHFSECKSTYVHEKTLFFTISHHFIDNFHNSIDLQFKDCLSQTINWPKELPKTSILYKYIQSDAKLSASESLTCKQLIQCMQKTAREGFQILSKSSFTQESLQTQLEVAKSSVQKAYIQVIIDQWKQLQEYVEKFGDFAGMESVFKLKEEAYFLRQSDYRQVDDEIEEIKDEIEELSEKNSRVIELHSEMLTKIQNLESVLIILKKLKNTIHSQEKQSQHEQKEQTLTVEQKQALKILLTVCMKEQITNPDSQQFKTIKHALLSLGYEVNEKLITNILHLEQRVNFEYCLADNTFKSVVNHLVVELSPIFCVVVDAQKQLQTCLKQWSKKPVTFVKYKNEEDLKNMLSTAGFYIFKNPSDSLITQLKPILQHKPETISSKKSTFLIEDFTLHEGSKLIFLYECQSQIDKRIKYQTEWVCEMSHQAQQKQRVIKNSLCRLVAEHDPGQLAENYLERLKQLQTLGEKMHSFVVKMKKQNLTPQQIQQRLEEVSQRKINIEKDIKQYKNQLKQIFISKHDLQLYAHLLLDLANSHHIQIHELFLILKKCYAEKSNDLSLAVALVSEVVKGLFIPASSSLKGALKTIHNIDAHNSGLLLAAKDLHRNAYDIRSSVMAEIQKVHPDHFKLLIKHFSLSNTVLITSQPNILKRCLTQITQKSNIAFVQRKVSEIASISFVASVHLLTVIKTQKDWPQLIGLINSFRDKKLNINIVIICPQDISVPIDVRNVKTMRLSSVLAILLKIIDEQGKLQDADAQELLKIYQTKLKKLHSLQ